MECGCPREQLCDRCLANVISTLRGVAESRGWTWFEDIAGGTRAQGWKHSREQSLARARIRVADMGVDPRELDALAEFACKGAARRWRSNV